MTAQQSNFLHLLYAKTGKILKDLFFFYLNLSIKKGDSSNGYYVKCEDERTFFRRNDMMDHSDPASGSFPPFSN